ncbi:MAG: hypothetical protein HZA14_09295 [Nitrospirae bacterium]|nr:hypothetical protein [Nitrospirota bacterium]
MFDAIGQCSICKKEYTSMHVEYRPGTIVYICPDCLRKTKDYFIWLCMGCGRSYFRPKKEVLSRLEKYGVENASLLLEGLQLIQGIDICIACDPAGIVEYVNGNRSMFAEACAK